MVFLLVDVATQRAANDDNKFCLAYVLTAVKLICLLLQDPHGEGLFNALARGPVPGDRRNEAGRVRSARILPAVRRMAPQRESPYPRVRRLGLRRGLLQAKHRNRRPPGLRRLLQPSNDTLFAHNSNNNPIGLNEPFVPLESFTTAARR